MQLQQLALSDLDEMYKIDQVCFPKHIAFSKEMFDNCLADPDCYCDGIREGDQLIAFSVLFFPMPEIAHIITIDVLPEFRRKGLGRCLMEKMDSRIRERGAARTVLQVAMDNDSAITLYLDSGFRIRGEKQDYYGPGLNAFLMDKWNGR